MKCPTCLTELPRSVSICPFCNTEIICNDELTETQHIEEFENYEQNNYEKSNVIDSSEASAEQSVSDKNQKFSSNSKKIFSIICVVCIALACICGYQAYKSYGDYTYAYEFYKEAAEAQGDSIRYYIKLKDSEYYSAQALAGDYYSQYLEYKSIADKYNSICKMYKNECIVYVSLCVTCIAAPIIIAIVKKKINSNKTPT